MVKGAGIAPAATSFCKWRRETRNSFAASLGVRMSGVSSLCFGGGTALNGMRNLKKGSARPAAWGSGYTIGRNETATQSKSLRVCRACIGWGTKRWLVPELGGVMHTYGVWG